MVNENMKLEYITAEMEIIAFENEDIVTASGCTCEDHDEDESCVGDL